MNEKAPESRQPSLQSEEQNSSDLRTAKRSSFIVAVANQKGGVAKTTTVVSLGGALVNHNQEVLLVDLDAQANLTLALGKDPNRVRGSITEVMFNSATLLSVSRETTVPGLDLVPSNAGMQLAERFLPVRNNYELILRRSIDDSAERVGSPNYMNGGSPSVALPPSPSAIQAYDIVVLDCPPSMGAVTMNALNAANMLIIPTQPEYFSVYALRSMMATVRQVRDQHNPDLVYRILITMYDRRNRIHRDVCEQIRTTFGEGTFKTIIGIDTKLRESAVEGLPITHHKGKSRSAQQYDALAQELIAYVRKEEASELRSAPNPA